MTREDMKKWKRELGYTNEDIARLSGVPLGTVQKIFAGVTKAPRRQTIEAIREVLDGEEAWEKRRRLHDEAVLRDALARIDRQKAAQSDTLREAPIEYQVGTAARPLAETPSPFFFGSGEGPRPDTVGPYTIEDYCALPDTPRVELIDGWFFVMEAPSATHQRVLVDMMSQMLPCVEEHPECELFVAPFDVRLDAFTEDKTMVQPDLLITCSGKVDDKRLNGPPDLAVEITSPSSRRHDMRRKLLKYMDAGVREYWVVDPAREKVLVWRLEEDDVTTYTFDDTVPVHISDGACSVDLARIRQKLARTAGNS